MTITFEDVKTGKQYDSKTDFGLVVASVEIGAPDVRADKVEVPGMDGALDFTEFFGRPCYGNRQMTISAGFVLSNRFMQESTIRNALHGRKMQITLSDDATFYYTGRVTVPSMQRTSRVDQVELTVDCDPYKRKKQQTVISQSGSGTVQLSNLQMPVTPRVTTTAAATLAWLGSSVALSAGADQLVPALTLEPGMTAVTVETTGVVTFTYREGGF